MTGRVHNFNPGPAALPLPVLEQVQAIARLCWHWYVYSGDEPPQCHV